MLPVINGCQGLEQTKADQPLGHIPVMITTDLDEADGKEKSMGLGAEDHLPKPFNPVTLESRIGDCLNRHHGARSRT